MYLLGRLELFLDGNIKQAWPELTPEEAQNYINGYDAYYIDESRLTWIYHPYPISMGKSQ